MPKHLQIISPFRLNWLDYMASIFTDWRVTATDTPKPDLNPDVMLFMWCDDQTIDFINKSEKRSKYIVFVRAYEYVEFDIERLDWKKVDSILCVNNFIAGNVEDRIDRKPTVIYNGVPLDKWTYREHGHGKKIAMVSFIHYKKNHPLALQILAGLPKDYELHCAGGIQNLDVAYYLEVLAKELNREIFLWGQIPGKEMNDWLEDKDYILCTSMREGCPNNVIEAMAKGIKPVIHHWPGAKRQFGDLVFNTIGEAVKQILPHSPYDSWKYRTMVEEKFSMGNYQKLRNIVEQLCA